MGSNAGSGYMYYMLQFDSPNEMAYYKTENRSLRKGDKVTIYGIDSQEDPLSGEIISAGDHMAIPARIPRNGVLLVTEEECLRMDFPYEYEKINGGLRLSRYIPHDDVTEIVIPNMIDGQKVIEIGDYAFASRTELEKVEIQEGIERIGKGTFAQCENLKEIVLPKSLKGLGSDAPTQFGRMFSNAIQQTNGDSQKFTEGTFMCSGLTTITIPENVSYIGQYCFASSKHLKNIVFPDHLSDFKEGVLALCSSLNRIKFPESLKEIGLMALGGCEQITEIRIPDGVKSLGQGAFASCPRLEKVYIPDSVTSMDETIFNQDDNLTIFCDPESYAWQFAQNHCFNHAKGEMYFESDWDEREDNSEDRQFDEMENQVFSDEDRDPIEITLNITVQENDESEDEGSDPDEEDEELKPDADNNYTDKAAALKKNIEILDSTFSKYGLKVLNIGGLEYSTYFGDPCITFYVELMSESETVETGYFHIKINIYDKNGELIAMGSEGLNFEEFDGYNTYKISVCHETIHERAAKVRIFFTK